MLMADDWGIGAGLPEAGHLITRLRTTTRPQAFAAAGLVGASMLARASGCWKKTMFAKPLTKPDPENPQFSRSANHDFRDIRPDVEHVRELWPQWCRTIRT